MADKGKDEKKKTEKRENDKRKGKFAKLPEHPTHVFGIKDAERGSGPIELVCPSGHFPLEAWELLQLYLNRQHVSLTFFFFFGCGFLVFTFLYSQLDQL